MTSAPVTAVVITYQSREVIGETMDALRAANVAGLLECIVVDNASSDGTAVFVEEHHDWATTIRGAENVGYGRACNVGLSLVKSEFVLFMNADVVLEAGALETLMRFMRTTPGAGVIAPAATAPDGTMQHAGALPTPWRIVWAASRGGMVRWMQPIVPASDAFQTDWLCGSVMLVRKALMDRLGGFDPAFFLYFEETDLCRRARQLGAELWAVGEAEARHVGGASAAQMGRKLYNGCIAEHYFRSRFYYLVKHHGRLAAWWAELGELLMMSARGVVEVVRGRRPDALIARLGGPVCRLPGGGRS